MRSLFRLLMLMSVAFVLGSCIDAARQGILFRYDPARDEFVYLNVYQGIECQSDAELNLLYHLWRNRADLITFPIPAILGSKPAILRLRPGQNIEINLVDARRSETGLLPADFDQIRVLPGTFFLRGPGRQLCYFDQVVAPGRVVDEVAELLANSARTYFIAAIDKELKRREEGGKEESWDSMRQRIRMHRLDVAPENATDREPATKAGASTGEDDYLGVLRMESLLRLRKVMADGTMKITRRAHRFELTIPLAAEDVKQLAPFCDACVKQAREEMLSVEDPKKRAENEAALRMLESFRLEVRDANTVQFRLDALKAFDALNRCQQIDAPLPPSLPKVNRSQGTHIATSPAIASGIADADGNTAAFLTGKGVSIDEKLTIKQVLNEFGAGTLKAVPAEPNVNPGEGLEDLSAVPLRSDSSRAPSTQRTP